MYLKQLVLKGFKSFADRSVLSFEPGISAVVGPNGSGKSNISDAVLWVLGERNAKNLRGQAMEDVIFAGSSARKPVSVAEVDLILDNSDGTLPVAFDEVSITRRMYRSGESEYLINGAAARRMDVLDILHDTGLGTGTHSIISQGSLDSILQSRPEDRRALIEEAAGVLKHKQRKQKSARKIEQMEQHVARVRDVVGEIQRQLGPLERKAKRALAYQEASGELAAISLALAVDDLRTLQGKWNQVEQKEEELIQRVDTVRQSVEAAEAALDALQTKVQEETLGAGELAKRFRAIQSSLERFDAMSLLLREKRRVAQRQAEQLEVSFEENRVQAETLRNEQGQASEQMMQVKGEFEEAKKKLDALILKRDELTKSTEGLVQALAASRNAQRKLRIEIETLDKRRSQTHETLTNNLAHEKLIAGHSKELEIQLDRATQEAETLRQDLAQASGQVDELEAQDQTLRSALSKALDMTQRMRDELNVLREGQARVNAQLGALEELERAQVEANPALSWMIQQARDCNYEVQQLSRVLHVPEAYDALVESLLGSDLEALLISDTRNAIELASAFREFSRGGSGTLLPLDGLRPALASKARPQNTTRLIDELECPANYRSALEALLGDVHVCTSLEEALELSSKDKSGARFVTLEGFIVWPSGKVSLALRGVDAETGALERQRRRDSLLEEQASKQKQLDELQEQLNKAEEEQRLCQNESLKVGQELASAKGRVQAAKNALKSAEEKLMSLRREFEDLMRQQQEAQEALALARPTIDELDNRLSALNKELETTLETTRRQQRELDPLQGKTSQTVEELNEAKLQVATLRERASYAERMVLARKQDLEALERRDKHARAECAVWQGLVLKIEPLLQCFESLADSARYWIDRLEAQTQETQDATTGLHAQVNAAREAARAAHNAFDAANGELSTTRVEKGRLEVQVQAAIDTIVKDCKTPLEQALELPRLEQRSASEEQAFALRRRIANMGTINPDAADEYEQLKERYDYLDAQLQDLESTKRSLAKIVRAIDERMRDDFARTFDSVNQNFQEIFSLLFPGGSASLSLTDSENPEESGIEVHAQPRGKRITKMMLMSGGEKSLTALALLFAVYKIRTTPFYILDEVEAALDDTNLRRLVSYLDSQREETQLIMITHQRRTMEMADALFGVSMQSDGITKVVSQRL